MLNSYKQLAELCDFQGNAWSCLKLSKSDVKSIYKAHLKSLIEG